MVHIAKSVLVLEDYASLRRALAGLLKRNGYTVLDCETGTQALELIREEKISVCIFDFELVGETGLDVARRVVLDRPERVQELQIVFYTSAPDKVGKFLAEFGQSGEGTVNRKLCDWIKGRVIDKNNPSRLLETLASL